MTRAFSVDRQEKVAGEAILSNTNVQPSPSSGTFTGFEEYILRYNLLKASLISVVLD
jgi:hypothetical protein